MAKFILTVFSGDVHADRLQRTLDQLARTLQGGFNLRLSRSGPESGYRMIRSTLTREKAEAENTRRDTTASR